MSTDLLLASGSEIRATLLRNAGVEFDVKAARVDEEAIKQALLAEEATPRDVADALAEFKAEKAANTVTQPYVLGCDQVLDFKGTLLSKPDSKADAITQLGLLQGKTHRLFSAAVIYQDAKPIWRACTVARLTMRQMDEAFLTRYVDRNWDSIRHAVGGYKLEEEGSRLFASVDGDYFTVLGLPLLPILGFLTARGVLDG